MSKNLTDDYGVRRQRTKRPDRSSVQIEEEESNEKIESLSEADQEVSAAKDRSSQKSVENTVKKQNYIIQLCRERGGMSINQLMEAVREEFGTRIAFPKAKEALVAFERNLEITPRDRRRDRTANRLSINRHESMKVIVAVVDKNGKLTETHLCDGDERAMHVALQLLSNGTDGESIQIYQRCHFTAQLKW